MFGRLTKVLSRAVSQVHKSRKPLSETPGLDGKRFLFIGGLHRSGTSILHRLLREHPDTSGFHDTGVQEDEGQHLQSVFPAAHRYGGPGEFALHSESHLTENSNLITHNNKEKLLREWGAYYDLEKKVLLEKSPPNLVRSRYFRQMFPGSQFVFIVRHPIAVALATEKWSKNTITEHMLHWRTAHSIMLDDIGSNTDCLLIRYEDLILQPQNYLDRICEMLDIVHFTPAESVEDHNKKYFREWKQRCKQKNIDLSSVLPADDAVMKAFGYTLEEPFVCSDCRYCG